MSEENFVLVDNKENADQEPSPKEINRDIVREAIARNSGTEKRGRGRPPGSKSGSAAKNSGNEKPNNHRTSEPAPIAVDPELLKRSIHTLLRVVDGINTRKIGQIAFKITGNAEDARSFVADAALTQNEADLMSDLGASIMVKYGFLGRFAPEAMLLISLGTWGARSILVWKSLDELAGKLAKIKGEPQAQTV